MRSMYLIGLGLFMTLAFACKKDEDSNNCEKLKGTWQLESWKEGNEELFGDTIFIGSGVLQFGELTDLHGDFTLNIDYLLGGPENLSGEYIVNSDCDEVTLTPTAGLATHYNYHFDGDLLYLDVTVNSVLTELRFKRE